MGWLRSIFRVRTPLVLQIEAAECGAACLTSILGWYGRWERLEDVRTACGIGRDGCSMGDIVRAAKEYGLVAQGWKQEIEDLENLNLPIILFWEFRHFVILEGISKGKFHINDPAHGRRTIDKEGIDRGYTGVVVTVEPSESFQRNKKPPSVMRQLWPWIKDFKPALVIAVLAGLLLAVPFVAAPVLLGLFVDYALQTGDSAWRMGLIAVMASTAVIAYVLTWFRQKALRKLAISMAITQSDHFVGRLLKRPVQFFNQRMTGDLISRTQSIEHIANFGVNQTVSVLVDLTMSLAFLSLMFAYSPILASVIALIAMICGFIARLANRNQTDNGHCFRREQGLLAGIGFIGLKNIGAVRATAGEDDLFTRWSGHQAREINARQVFEETGHITSAVPTFFVSIGGVAALGLGGWQAMAGSMSLGTMITFYMLSWSFLQPIGRYVQFIELLRTLEAEIHRLQEISGTQESEPKTESKTEGIATVGGRLRLRGRVELINVTFGFTPQKPPFIENFNLVIEPGQRVAIVGPSGSGKSTLSYLVSGIYTPWSGKILFDGMEREEIPIEVLRDSISVVMQSSALITGSVRDNLTLWDPNVPDSLVVAAARDADIHEEIIVRSNGYSTIVEEDGRNFSGGQRQRLEIARALVPNPSVLVLDEATASLDAITEVRIDDAIRRRGCSCLIVAHRLSTIRDCDRIIVLKNGQVVQDGTHDELVEIEGMLYRELVHAH